jgi:hypothetical protein
VSPRRDFLDARLRDGMTMDQAAAAAQAAGLTPLHPRLIASLRRCAFLLNSAHLVITDPIARDTAAQAVAEARGLIAEAAQ